VQWAETALWAEPVLPDFLALVPELELLEEPAPWVWQWAAAVLACSLTAWLKFKRRLFKPCNR
jgi:hypothetical protein